MAKEAVVTTTTTAASADPVDDEGLEKKRFMSSSLMGLIRRLPWMMSRRKRRRKISKLTDGEGNAIEVEDLMDDDDDQTPKRSLFARYSPKLSIRTTISAPTFLATSMADLKKPSLLLKSEMPYWYQHTPFILTGYRAIQHSFKGCIHSLNYLHNETVNIWTHALGAALFVALFGLTWGKTGLGHEALQNVQLVDHVLFAAFHLAALYCFTASSSFHLFCCHSQNVQLNCLKADFVGIVTLILGSMIPSLYYGFYCSPIRRFRYMVLEIVCGIATITINVSNRFQGPKWRPLRTILFVVMGLTGVIPIVDGLINNKFELAVRSASLDWIALETFFFLFGALLFGFHVPERWAPGYFDTWGQSHQWFHIAIVIGTCCHYTGLMRSAMWWHSNNPYCHKDFGGWK